MIKNISKQKMLVCECGLPGETKADRVYPAHPNGYQLSKNCFMLVYSTCGLRGVDDGKSIVYQLRRGGFTGPVIREGFLTRTRDDWDVLGDGGEYVRQCGHIVICGLPKDAVVNGDVPAHHNHFIASWRITARLFDKEKDVLHWSNYDTPFKEKCIEVERAGQGVEWLQFRLNDTETDIEIIVPAAKFKQKGYEESDQLCSIEGVEKLNRSYVNPIAFNEEKNEWLDMLFFRDTSVESARKGSFAAAKIKYNSEIKRYEWVETSPSFNYFGKAMYEACAVKGSKNWIFAPRIHEDGCRIWYKGTTVFGNKNDMRPFISTDYGTNAPHSAYLCPDGVVRIFTGEKDASVPGSARNPLYVWDIDPETFERSNRKTLFGFSEQNLLQDQVQKYNCVDFCKLLTHTGGNKQTVVYRVKTHNLDYQNHSTPPMNDKQFQACGIYMAELEYDQDYPADWSFWCAEEC